MSTLRPNDIKLECPYCGYANIECLSYGGGEQIVKCASPSRNSFKSGCGRKFFVAWQTRFETQIGRIDFAPKE